MKKIYMAQPNSQYGDSVYFPYAAGSLIAYAFEDAFVRQNYTFGSFFYKKIPIEETVAQIEDPYLVGFSCYVWNYEYNKALAAEIKRRWPECIIVFGGHQICRDSDVVHSDCVDVIILGEGEDAFRQILRALAGEGELCAIPNILYRRDGTPVFTEKADVCIPDRVSPYLGGWFDEMLEKERDVTFSAILETNRGCPNRCAFCDWGNIKARVRSYPLDLVLAEIDWMSDKKIEYVYCADANFGLFPRDLEILDYVIRRHNENGFPEKFQATYSKNNPDTVFELNKRLNEAGMSKGATLSFQSMSPTVLEHIYRKNMPLSSFKKLMELYHAHGIPTYSEIILGMPGETYESFRDGIEQLLENGQHMSINFYNCELLSNSKMHDPEYMELYRIRTARTEQHQYHTLPHSKEVMEYSDIVVSTSTMTEEQWVRSNVFSVFVRAFHNLGLLQCFAIYLYYECNIRYTDFYERLIGFAQDRPDSVCGRLLSWVRNKYREVLTGNGSLTWHEPAFGELTWPMEEASFLTVLKDLPQYRAQIREFLLPFFRDRELFDDLLTYQNAIVKTPQSVPQTLSLRYDWYAYFAGIYERDYGSLQKKNVALRIDPGEIRKTLPEFAVHTIWFGRRGGQNIVKDIRYADPDGPDA